MVLSQTSTWKWSGNCHFEHCIFGLQITSLFPPKCRVLRIEIKYGISNLNMHASTTSVQMMHRVSTFPDLWNQNFNDSFFMTCSLGDRIFFYDSLWWLSKNAWCPVKLGSHCNTNLLHLLYPHNIIITYISKNVSIIFLHKPLRPGWELIWTPGSQSANLRAPKVPTSSPIKTIISWRRLSLGWAICHPATGSQRDTRAI